MRRICSVLFVFLVFVCMSLGAGCSKPRVEMAVASQPNVNPDHSNRPSPIIVKIYELRNDLTFKQAEFNTLFDTPLQVLGADLIAADELVFIPGEARRVAYQPNTNTRFVGIVAGFRQMDRALWRVLKPVDPEKGNLIAIELNDATILVIPDKEAEDWDPEEAVRQFQQRLVKPQQPTTTGVAHAQPGSMYPAQPSREIPSTTSQGAQPASAPVSTSAGTQAEQVGKESITIINQSGIETLPGRQGLGSAPEPATPASISVITPSLPSMRPF